jgi:dGTP triphosphohydrolase
VRKLTFLVVLDQNTIEMVELQEEVTQARVAAVMAGARTAQADRMAQEKVILLATTRGEADEAAWRVSVLEDKLVATRPAQDATKEKFPSVAAQAVMAHRRWEATEEQCECLVHELTLMSLRGSELCMTITSAPLLPPCTRECTSRWPNTPRWLRGYSRFGR